MAATDFEINIRTLADLTGIKLTQAQLDALQQSAAQGNVKAIAALKQLSDAQKQAAKELEVGFTGTSLGVGTIIYLVTGAIARWKAFNDELDKWVEGMIKAQEKARDLGESIIEMQDAMIAAALRGGKPLEDQLKDLQQAMIRLKTEQSLLNLPTQGEEWKKYAKQINETASEIEKVTGALDRQAKTADEAAKKREKAAEKESEAQESFLSGAIKSSSAQTQAVLRNEAAAQRARTQGDERSAALFEKSAQAFERGMTPEQRQELESLRAAGGTGALKESTQQDIVRILQNIYNVWR